MDLQLRGRTAFISGSTQGIGYAIASALAAEGMRVIVNGREDARVEAAVDRLRRDQPGATVSGIAADFGDPGDVTRLLGSLDDVDVLVNNVGLFGLAAFESIADEDWSRYFEVNVMSGVRLSRHLLGGMLERGWGRIVFIGSESGVNVPADMVHYGVAKAAVIALANGLAKQTRGTSVTINTVLGGPVLRRCRDDGRGDRRGAGSSGRGDAGRDHRSEPDKPARALHRPGRDRGARHLPREPAVRRDERRRDPG